MTEDFSWAVAASTAAEWERVAASQTPTPIGAASRYLKAQPPCVGEGRASVPPDFEYRFVNVPGNGNSPLNFRKFFGVDEIGPPIAIYNCQFGNEFAIVEPSARNHYGAISVLDVQKLQTLVETYQAPQQQALCCLDDETRTKGKGQKKEVISEESEDRIVAFRLRALLRPHRDEDRTVGLNKFGLYLLRLGALTKGASRDNTLELTELGKWFKIPLAEIREWEGSYAWKFGYTSVSNARYRPHAGIIAEKIAQERMQTFSDVVDKVAEELAQERSKPFAGDRTTLSDKFEFLRSFEGDDKLFDIVQAFASKEERRRRVIAAAKRRRSKLIEKRNKKRYFNN
ncbi:hypothetical protein GN958_ATG21752 [Phytophthora infestans]|uniref:Uncharacterized protein n=1 Tax=Phytophthora infestans TaxID=4787 RepID=A0A8S9TJB7_PHYIN|nr:hypothetical protein GN958_ATG21752 [Phytophthora infestans]